MLTRKGVIAWRAALTDLTPGTRAAPTATAAPAAAAAAPAPVCAELVNALAAVVLAGT